MDNLERYEDSYAVAEEFREWILHIREKDENLKDSFLNFPKGLKEFKTCLKKKNADLKKDYELINIRIFKIKF